MERPTTRTTKRPAIHICVATDGRIFRSLALHMLASSGARSTPSIADTKRELPGDAYVDWVGADRYNRATGDRPRLYIPAGRSSGRC